MESRLQAVAYALVADASDFRNTLIPYHALPPEGGTPNVCDMDLLSAINLGFKEIWAHKFRSLLTMLGIILGVSSLVAMSALVKGMEVGMKEALIAIGGLQKIRVEPQELPIEQKHLTDQALGVTLNDVYALKASAPLVIRLSPEM